MAEWLAGAIPEGFQLGGLVVELVGVGLMANSFLRAVGLRLYPVLFVSALVRGKVARGAVKVARSQEDYTRTLQGLSFIAFGFLLQVVGTVVGLCLRLAGAT